jgi:hypothetical protein
MINNGQIVDKGEVSELNDNGSVNVPKEIIFENESSSSSTCNSPLQVSPVKENTEEIFEKNRSSDVEVIEDKKIINDTIIDDNNKPRVLIKEEGI